MVNNSLFKSLVIASFVVMPLSAKFELYEGKNPATYINDDGKTLYVKTHDPRNSVNTLAIVDAKKDEDGDFKNFQVRRDVWWNFGAYKKGDNKHNMDTPLGNAVLSFFDVTRLKRKTEYQGSIILDEYASGNSMYWFLSDVEKLREIRKYFDKNIVYITKPLLLLEIENDDNLSTLNSKDKAFLDKYFTLPDSQGEIELASKFFAQSRKDYFESVARVEGAKPNISLGSDVREYIFYKFQKACGEFKNEKMLLLFLDGLILGYLGYELKKYLKNSMEEAVANQFEEAKANWANSQETPEDTEVSQERTDLELEPAQ